jgi:two-component system NtrC family response regulator
MERLVVTIDGSTVHAEDLPQEVKRAPRQGTLTLEAAVAEAEREAILAALDACNQHRERAAQLLAISVRTLHYKMNRHALQ